jgi:hypothetical protein
MDGIDSTREEFLVEFEGGIRVELSHRLEDDTWTLKESRS